MIEFNLLEVALLLAATLLGGFAFGAFFNELDDCAEPPPDPSDEDAADFEMFWLCRRCSSEDERRNPEV